MVGSEVGEATRARKGGDEERIGCEGGQRSVGRVSSVVRSVAASE